MAQAQASAEAAKARAFAMQQARRALGEQDSEKGSAASAGSSGAGGSDAGGVMTVTDFERIIEATLNQLLSDLSDSDEVPLRQLMRALPPRAALAGQEAVETALDSMEKANKVMLRGGVVHLI